ncbi:MAG: AmpG family muropeptide MFS transporter [Verrucomicrobia bacterium]|jgi:PAT family beta-lactamase induction signal transducer AmpG|nr:MAG: AmpG family muropeptide MFS transporter [Verrucomicrobiota bacterium]
MNSGQKQSSRSPWAWVPTLYTAEGLPYVLVMTLSVVMYKGLGISNTDIALYTSWLYLPWVIKPLWSPVVDILRTRRWWIWTMQLLIGGGLAGVALTIPTTNFFQWTLACFWLLAFSSATHDIAADGFYLLATTEKEQSFFVGIRSTFYRVSNIFGQGLLVILAGYIQSHTGLPKLQLAVEARPETALVESVLPTSATLFMASEGELRVLAEPASVTINSQPRAKSEVSALLASAKQSNITNNFTRTRQQLAAATKKDESPSWWTRSVSEPAGRFLRQHFGPDVKAKSDIAGNLAVVSLHLSKPPGKEIVVTPAFKSGDKSVSLAEGGRLVFDDSNWNKPALVVLQLDPKLKTATSATFEIRSGNIPLSWTITFFTLVGLFILFGVWHRFILPHPASDKPGDAHSIVTFISEFFKTFGSFFVKERIGILLLFLLLYRFGESQLVKMVVPFLLDGREVGGLGLTTGQVGLVYGTIGIIALTCGGLLGGMVASRHGLKKWLWPMVCIIHLPDAAFIYLAYAQPDSLVLISAAVAVEQFGYGFGFTAYMLYMIYIARGKHQTAHYAICTGFMALGMMIPGMWSGWLQELIGYQHFFIWVILATIPSFIVVLLIPLDKEFGKKA